MFSSENNSYPLYYQSPSFANTISESNNILFQHHHLQHGKTNNYIMPPTYPQISENPMFKYSSQPLINQEHTINYPLNFINHMSSTRKTSGKKDRHTKIRTAQGVRDRRVRLSMSIAREFFNLQDMLGYDKASKTLGWLLAKSKAAIDELASSSKNNNIVAPLEGINNGEDDDEEDNDNCEEANNDEKKRDLSENKLISKKRKKRESNRLNKVEVSDKEAKRREKARERARERTRNKKILDDQKLLKSLDHQLHQRVQQDLMVCNSSSAATPNNNNVSPSYGCFGKGVSVGESVVIKGNKPRLGSSFNYNYDMISSKDDQETCNHYNDYIINKSSSESCNYGGIMQSPGLFPALNIINLSTEIHINGRPWDTFNNQILH